MLVQLGKAKRLFQFLLVVMFLFLLSGCRSSLNRIEIGDEIYFWTVEQNLDTEEFESVKVTGIVSQVVEYEDYYIVRLQGDIRPYQIDKEKFH
jgi:lipoprotein